MSIRIHIISFFFLTIPFSLFAQRDTAYQTVRQESGEYQAPIVETPADRLFRIRVPSKWMFKLDLSKVPFFEDHYLSLGAEYKFAPSFSVAAYYETGFANKDRDRGGWLYPVSIAVESRWYHDMRKRTRAGRSANNFGGRYISLEGSVSDLGVDPLNVRRVALRYGLQQRILRNGYFDVSIGAGLTEKTPYHGNAFGIDQQISLGLAAFLPKVKTAGQNSNICDVLHCQDEQFRMFKLDVINLLDFQATKNSHYLSLRPNIAFEQKLGRSPFSVEMDLELASNSGNFGYFNSSDF
jgi:hypothetical protein